MEKVILKILEKIKKAFDYQAFEDLYYLLNETDNYVEYGKQLSELCEQYLGSGKLDIRDAHRLFELHKKLLLKLSKDDFESYMLYTEWNREPEKKFYPPRRKALKPIVDALQELADGKLELLAISMPPGTGKTTLATFFLTWLAGKYPDEPMLTGSHSASFIRGVYDECLRMMDKDGDYLWQDVFRMPITSTNAKDCRIDLGKPKRFETLEFTSIGTGNAGLFRASRLLYCDDLISGIEVALSKDRLDKLWETYTTDLRQRKIGDHCGELHIATRWSLFDPIGRLQDIYGDSDKAKFISFSALDENDESNFNYAYGVGFSTEFYHQQREIMEDASWRALYMNQPIEREGRLYSDDELRRFYELPQAEPDAILAVCDTKDTGKDYCVMPIAYKYGHDYYIWKILCDNSNPEVVEARLVSTLCTEKVHMCRFESNSAGGHVATKVQDLVKSKGGRCLITKKFTTANKETKIIVNAPYVKTHFLFLDDSVADKEYKDAMKFLCNYTMAGKNKHDDVPDAMAMLSEYVQTFDTQKVEVFRRPF